MGMKTYPFEEGKVTAAQLATYATKILGLDGDINYRQGWRHIASLIRAVEPELKEITIHEEDSPTITARVEPAGKNKGARRMATVNIGNQDRSGGDEPVFVAVNGTAMYVPRGDNVDIPYEYKHVLDNAIKGVPQVDKDGVLTGFKPTPEYPVSTVRVDEPADPIDGDPDQKHLLLKKVA